MHNELNSNNVLQKGKEFRVIDLEEFEHHHCEMGKRVDFLTISKNDGREYLTDLCGYLRAYCNEVGFNNSGEYFPL